MEKKTADVKSCKEIQGLIPGYLAGSLNLKEAKQFTGHIKKCAGCRDEVEISYLLAEGLHKAEQGETIDLHADLEEMLGETEEAIQHLTQFRTAVYLVEITAVFVLIACVLILYLY
jgi:hypothetical protein